MPTQKVLILGHAEPTQKISSAVRGEMTNAIRIRSLLQDAQYQVHDIVDILDLYGGDVAKLYEPLAHLNLDLAKMEYEIVEEMSLPQIQTILSTLLEKKADCHIILSWVWSVAALFATGIHRKKPTITKLYVHQENEIINRTLYMPSDVLITESLLANKKAIEHGIPPWKLIFLPNCGPEIKSQVLKNRNYLYALFKKNGKKISFTDETFVMGAISRLECGKNIEFALESAQKLHNAGKNILFVLKGRAEEQTFCPTYRDWLQNLVKSLENESWFIWDDTYSPLNEMPNIFATFDLFVHLSGSEAGSNVIIESMRLRIPALILNASTNPYLYKGGAVFVENNGEIPSMERPYAIPNKDDLFNKMCALVENKNWCDEVAQNGQKIALQRFSKASQQKRINLAIRAAIAFHNKEANCDQIKKEIEELYEQDLKSYLARA